MNIQRSKVEKIKFNSIYSLDKSIKGKNIFPIYYFIGEDKFTIDEYIKEIEKTLSPQIVSEFNKEVINFDKGNTLQEVIDNAYSFPFGGGKKLLIIKEFKLVDQSVKTLLNYIKDPASDTVLIFQSEYKATKNSTTLFEEMIKLNYIYEAGELKGIDLINWITRQANLLGLKINEETASILVDYVGNSKSLLEMQLQKYHSFLDGDKEITLEVIKNNTALTKEYSSFDFQDAINVGNEKKAVFLAIHLIDKGKQPLELLGLLIKYFTTIARTLEYQSTVNDNDVAKEIGASWFYIKKLREARQFRNEVRILNILRILEVYDTNLKSRIIEPKAFMISLISEIFSA